MSERQQTLSHEEHPSAMEPRAGNLPFPAADRPATYGRCFCYPQTL